MYPSGVTTNMMPMYFNPNGYEGISSTTHNGVNTTALSGSTSRAPQHFAQLPSYSSHAGTSGPTIVQSPPGLAMRHPSSAAQYNTLAQPQLMGASSSSGVPPSVSVNSRVSSMHTGHMGMGSSLGGLGASLPPPPPPAMPSTGPNTTTTPQQLYRNLYVSGLPAAVNDDDLKEVFGAYGKIESAKVMIDVSTGMSRGFAFVLFSRVEEGCAAFGSLNGKDVTIKGETFKMKMMPSEHDGRQASQPTPIIYVRNIPFGASETMVRLHFEKFGEVVSFSMRPISSSNNPSGTITSSEPSADTLYLATVEYRTTEGAAAAIDGTHNKKIFDCCTNPVLAKFADTQEMKDAKKAKRGQHVGSAGGHSISVGMPALSVGISGQPMQHTMAAPMQIVMGQTQGGLMNHPVQMGGAKSHMGSLSQHPIMMMSSNPSAHTSPPMTIAANPMYPTAQPAYVPQYFQPTATGSQHPTQFASPQHLHHDQSGGSPAPYGTSAPSSTKVQYASASHTHTPLSSTTTPVPSNYLPLPPRVGEQALVYYQGVLMKTPEGLLVPVHVEHCQYVDGQPLAMPPHSPLSIAPPGGQLQTQLQPSKQLATQSSVPASSTAPLLLSVSFQQQHGSQTAPNESSTSFGHPAQGAGIISKNQTPIAYHTSTPPLLNNKAPSSSSSCAGQRPAEVGQFSDGTATVTDGGSLEGGNGSVTGGLAPSMWNPQQLLGSAHPSALAPTSPFLYH